MVLMTGHYMHSVFFSGGGGVGLGGSLGNMINMLGHYFNQKRCTKKCLVLSGHVDRVVAKFLRPRIFLRSILLLKDKR